jgi:ATP-dependent RNA helicase DOB1
MAKGRRPFATHSAAGQNLPPSALRLMRTGRSSSCLVDAISVPLVRNSSGAFLTKSSNFHCSTLLSKPQKRRALVGQLCRTDEAHKQLYMQPPSPLKKRARLPARAEPPDVQSSAPAKKRHRTVLEETVAAEKACVAAEIVTDAVQASPRAPIEDLTETAAEAKAEEPKEAAAHAEPETEVGEVAMAGEVEAAATEALHGGTCAANGAELQCAPAVRADPPVASSTTLASKSVAAARAARPYSFSVRVESSGNASDGVDPGVGATGTAPAALGESPALLKTYCFPGSYSFEDRTGAANAAESPTVESDEAATKGKKPAKSYPFSLDAFQRESIRCIERGENVLVAAHTSAGKTVVAEYAIAMSLRDKQRVIYTSPIKALSNQKFREFSEEFIDVGLMTGDVTINKNASCLIMTTEIYRSMLYRGSEVVREVAWVIFDEVHAMRSKDRGTVWEESFILSPENVHFIFLSATIPNAREFSEWIAKLKNKPCHTIYTDTRPVPLQHYIFPKGGAGLHLVVDDKGQFRPDSFEQAMSAFGNKSGGPGDQAGSSGGTKRDKRRGRGSGGAPGDKSDCFKVITTIMDRNFYPVIVFSFARRECESLALQVSKLDFNSDTEKELVRNVYESAVESLMAEDRDLPQVAAALPLLERGIGIHHAGLLPVVKEVVEILFQEGLIKALFATETFSMGLNMPAKTVVFTELRKFDGETTRYISSGEYVQMSGRAGRRGLDASGIAILMCGEQIEPKIAKEMMCGSAEPLNSSFRLGYNMLLNLLRAEEANPEYVIARSFAQFQGDRALPENEAKVVELESERDAIVIGAQSEEIDEKAVRDYCRLRDVAEKLRAEMRDVVHKPQYVVPFLQPGRLVRIRERKSRNDFGWGVVVKCIRRANVIDKKEKDERFYVDVLVRCMPESGEGKRPRPFKGPVVIPLQEGSVRNAKVRTSDDPKKTSKGDGSAVVNGGGLGGRLGSKDEWIVVSFSLRDLDGVSAIRVFKPEDLRPIDNRASVGSSVCEALRRLPGGPPMLDPLGDMEISEESFGILLRKLEAIEEAMKASPLTSSRQASKLMGLWKQKSEVIDKIKEAKLKVKLGQGLMFKDDLKQMKRVLRRLDFITEDGVIEVKGRLACEVNTADELVLTELLLGGALNDMTPEILVAVCSCFVVDESKKDEAPDMEKELQNAFNALRAVCTRVATVKKESKIHIDVEEYVDSFSPVAMKVVYNWCLGKSFAEVCQLTQMFEGAIVRCMRRLEELLRQLVTAAKSIGNSELEQKIEQGSEKLKRGIAFQSSLYT